MSELFTALPNKVTKVTEKLHWLQQLNNYHTVTELRQQLQHRYHKLITNNLTKLIIVGAAGEGKRLADLCAKYAIEIIAHADDNPAVQGTEYAGKQIVPTANLADLDKNVPIIVATHRVLKPIQRMKALGFNQVVPFAYLQIMQPDRFPPHMFYERWLEDLIDNKAQLNDVVQLFADDFSYKVFDAVLGFRLTLDPAYLEPIVEWDLYGPNNLLQYGKNEVYLDGGTFDGDSIALFIERVNGKFDRIIGFEPDSNTFQRLAANFAHDKRVEPVNKGLYSHATVLKFDNAGDRGAIFTENAAQTVEVPVTSIDQHLAGARVTFIKMNIEGAEIAALNGSKATIKRYAPKLAISVYHRPSDLWEIPLLIKSLCQDYQLYLRQHDGGVIETVVYAIKK